MSYSPIIRTLDAIPLITALATLLAHSLLRVKQLIYLYL